MIFLSTAKTQAQSPPAWIKDTVVGQVEFYHSIIDCQDKKAVLLKFNNLNQNSRKISWKEVLQTQATEKVEAASGLKTLILPAGITSATGCAETIHRTCLVLPMDVSKAYAVRINQYFFTEISVTTNQ